MKWYHYLICCIICILGAISAIGLFNLFNVSSKEYGKVLEIESIQNLEVKVEYDLGYLEFISEDNLNYEYQINQAPIKFDGSQADYILIVNGKPANEVKVSNGEISGNLDLNFYDTEGELITTSHLEILIEFLASDTRLTFKTQNINNSNAYLYRYLNINGFNLKIVTKGDK